MYREINFNTGEANGKIETDMETRIIARVPHRTGRRFLENKKYTIVGFRVLPGHWSFIHYGIHQGYNRYMYT